jgi:hypothetical protein
LAPSEKSLLPTRNIQQTTIDRKRKFAKIPDHLPLTKSEITAEHKAAQTTLKSIRANNAEYRRLRLELYANAIDAAANKAPGQKTNTILQLQHQEEKRLIYKKCQEHMGKGRGPGIKELLVPTDNTEDPTNDTKHWTIEGDKENITKAIMNQNQKKISKKFNTPFACGTLKETLGADGTTDADYAMLRGSYEITSPIPELKEFIETLKKTKHPRHRTSNNTENVH